MITRPPSRGTFVLAIIALIIALPLACPVWVDCLQAQDGNDDESGMMPVRAQDLFAALPGKLENWKLTRSTAELRYSGWMQSRVVREYERQLPAEKGEDPPPLSTTRISIVDTGRHTSAISVFEDFAVGEDEGFERKLIDGDPAFLIESDAAEREIEILVAGRFIVRIISRNQPEKFFEKWLNRLDRKKLRSIPDTPTIKLPDTILISHIDQLAPDKNHAYQLATSSSSRVSAEVEEDQAWLNKVLGTIPEIPDSRGNNSDNPNR